MKQSIFERITQQIADAIEAGAETYVMPWHSAGASLECPTNAVTGRTYRGLNILSLWIEADTAGFATSRWATYRQWASVGCQVRKGERGSPVFFWERRGTRSVDDPSEGGERRRPGFVAKSFTVFNASQVEGYKPTSAVGLSECERLACGEEFIRSVGANIAFGGDRAFYSPGHDRVQMPEFGQFRSPSNYYSVLTHELVHWSGAKMRLDRKLGQRFGDHDYAMEELIAELGAAFVCAQLGIPTEPRRDHAPYIASWLKALRSDPRAIFTAASMAQQAAEYLLAFGKAPFPMALAGRPSVLV